MYRGIYVYMVIFVCGALRGGALWWFACVDICMYIYMCVCVYMYIHILDVYTYVYTVGEWAPENCSSLGGTLVWCVRVYMRVLVRAYM